MSNNSINKKISHGTSRLSLLKAFDRYLNATGAGDYDLPHLTGNKTTESKRCNTPSYSF